MLFDERKNLLPIEYPEFERFCDAINASYWVHTEWSFIQDIHEFTRVLDAFEKQTLERTMLAISQVEVSVKTFWFRIPGIIKKPEMSMIAGTFGESEIRHLRAYSQLLSVLGLGEEFEKLNSVPCISGRLQYLEKYKEYFGDDRRKFLKSLVLFSLFVENVSLFGQFFIIASFKKYKNLLHDMTRVVNATAAEEDLHAKFGIFLINKIKEEYPELWDEDFERSLITFCEKAYEAECGVLDWILEYPTFIKKGLVKDFLKSRFNDSLKSIGLEPIFRVQDKSEFSWYNDLVSTSIHSDFFDGRPNTYSMKQKPITAGDLF